MELREFGPDDVTAVRAFVDLDNAVSAADSPWVHPETPYRREMRMRHGWDGEVGRHFLAYASDEPVGGVVVYTSEYDNLDLAWCSLFVHPGHRRRGHGRAMLEATYDVARSMGRTSFGTDGWESESTTGFTAATGLGKKSQAVNRRQHLKDLEPGLAQAVHDEAMVRAGDYELVRIQGHSPDDLLDQLSRVSAAINDAPLDDLEIEDEAYSPERIRAYEQAQEAGGMRLSRILARHRGTGELGGHTVVAVDTERPWIGDQHDTAVAREHRGHRLGALLKADMIRWLAEAEPQLETIDTWNTESNGHMIGINERLGYRIIGRELQFQRRI